MISAPSSCSSSTLSPLAPPFTVDRAAAAKRFQPYCYPPPSVPEYGGNGLVDGEESPAVETAGKSSSWMDPSMPYNSSQFRGGGAAQNYMTYGDAYFTWHGKNVDSLPRQGHTGVDTSSWRDEHQAVYEDKAGDSCSIGLSYFQISNQNIAVNERNQPNSDSSYDKYMSQLVSSSTEPVFCYPAATCSLSAEGFAPSDEPSSAVYFAPRNGYSGTQHGNLLYSVDDNYVDHVLDNREETCISKPSDGNQVYLKSGVADIKTKGHGGTWNSSIAASCSSGKDVPNKISLNHSSDINHAFRHTITESTASSSRPNSSSQSSPEKLDHPNLSVDSPCWKGASVMQRYSFGNGEMINHNLEMKESKGYDDLGRGENYNPTRNYLKTAPYLEDDGGPFCLGNLKGSLSFQGAFSPDISLQTLQRTDSRFHDANAVVPDNIEAGKEGRCYFSCVTNDKYNDVGAAEKAPEEEVEKTNRNVGQSCEAKSVVMSANGPAFKDGVAHVLTGLADAILDNVSDQNVGSDNHVKDYSVSGAFSGQAATRIYPIDPKAKCPKAGQNVRPIIEAIHGLSEVLLSSTYSGIAECEGSDQELVDLVIGNLITFIQMGKKGINECSATAPGPGCTHVSVPKYIGTCKKLNSTIIKDNEWKAHGTGSCMNNKFDVRGSNRMAQVMVKDLENAVFGMKEENPQAELYKTLWMQAEAALCSMKYDLQLVRMKPEMDGYQSQTKVAAAKGLPQVSEPPNLNIIPRVDASSIQQKKSLCSNTFHSVEIDAGKSSKEEQKEQKATESDNVDDSIMARLEILRGRYARSNAKSTEEQPRCLYTENTIQPSPVRLADLGFVESASPQPFDGNAYTNTHLSASKNKPGDMPRPVHNSNIENTALHPSDLGPVLGGASHVHTADGPFSQPFGPLVGSQANPMRFVLG